VSIPSAARDPFSASVWLGLGLSRGFEQSLGWGHLRPTAGAERRPHLLVFF
jgi:hypothetical protein